MAENEQKKVCQKCGREYTFRKFYTGCPFCMIEWAERFIAVGILIIAFVFGVICWFTLK